MNDYWNNIMKAKAMGPLGLIRLKAESLLARHNNGEFALEPYEIEELDRIAVMPQIGDDEYFQPIYRRIEPQD